MSDKRISTVNDCLESLSQNDIDTCITRFENLTVSTGFFGLDDRYQSVKDDYERMISYWKQDIIDPCLDNICHTITRRFADLLSEYISRMLNTEDACYLLSLKRMSECKGDIWEWNYIRQKLESYVVDSAFTNLNINDGDKERYEQIIDDHYEYTKRLFYHLLTSGLITGSEADEIIGVLSSPTIDSGDQQIIVSALTISGSRAFDINKFRIMADACRKASDMRVRQRALVGFVLTMGHGMAKIYPEQKDILNKVLSDESVYNQLIELQMQLVLCVKAIDDADVIVKEIIPGIISNSRYKFKDGKLIEDEEDTIDDIIGNDSEERRAEEVERLVGRMKEIQDSGSDFLFSNFSQMKNFPFFDEMFNWFLPFNNSIKFVRNLSYLYRDWDVFNKMLRLNGYCDIDKYSFAISLDLIYQKLPKEFLEMVKSIHEPSIDIPEETPTLYRRSYLQTLFRFFNLFKWKNGFFNPFEIDSNISHGNTFFKPVYIFVNNPLLIDTKWYAEALPRILLFLSRNVSSMLRRDSDYLNFTILDNYECNMAYAKYMINVRQRYVSSAKYLKRALMFKPDSKVAKKMLANSLMNEYPEEACPYFFEMLEANPEDDSIRYKAAYTALFANEYEKAKSVLYKLHYDYPDEDKINLLWGTLLLLNDDYVKAFETLDSIKSYEGLDSNFHFAFIAACWIHLKSVSMVSSCLKQKNINPDVLLDSDRGFGLTHLLSQKLTENGLSIFQLMLMRKWLKEGGE